MADAEQTNPWKHYRFGLLVTGRGESLFLHHLFRSVCDRVALSGRGTCEFCVIAKVEQLRPRTSPKHSLKQPGKPQHLPDRDEDLALRARGFLQRGGNFVILIDDLEGSWRQQSGEVYARYCEALDRILPAQLRPCVSVHFLVNMLEAYYFANAHAINQVMGTELTDYNGDVESIPHPKGLLKKEADSFDEIEHGARIIRQLDVHHVLSRPETCASLRTLFGWCWRALGLPPGEVFQLATGRYFDVTRSQIDQLPPASG